MKSSTPAETGVEQTAEGKEDLTVAISLISLNCHEVITFNSIWGKQTYELRSIRHFTHEADQNAQIIFEHAICLNYLLWNVLQKLFIACCHFVGGVREDIALVRLLKQLCKTTLAPKIVKTVAKQARRHVLTAPERTAPNIARKSTSNKSPEFGQVLVACLPQALLNIH